MGSEQEIRNLMVSCYKMGNAGYAQGNLEKAYECFRMSREWGVKLCRQSEDLFDRGEFLPQICEGLSRICEQLNRQEEAAFYCREGIEQRRSVLEIMSREDRIQMQKRAMVRDYRYLASYYEDMADEENVIACCREAIPLSVELFNAGETEEDGRNLLVFADRLGSSDYLSGNLDEALWCFQDAMNVRYSLQDEKGDMAAREMFAQNYEYLGHIYYRKGNFQLAMECYAEKLEIHIGLFHESPTPERFGRCAWSYYHLSTVLDDAGEREYLEKALGIVTRIIEQYPKLTEEYRALGMRCLEKLQRFRN